MHWYRLHPAYIVGFLWVTCLRMPVVILAYFDWRKAPVQIFERRGSDAEALLSFARAIKECNERASKPIPPPPPRYVAPPLPGVDEKTWKKVIAALGMPQSLINPMGVLTILAGAIASSAILGLHYVNFDRPQADDVEDQQVSLWDCTNNVCNSSFYNIDGVTRIVSTHDEFEAAVNASKPGDVIRIPAGTYTNWGDTKVLMHNNAFHDPIPHVTISPFQEGSTIFYNNVIGMPN